MPSASRWTGLILPYLLCVGMPWVLPWMPYLAAQAIESHADPGVIIGAKLGGGIGMFNASGVSYAAELELGYLLPLPDPVRHALQLFAASAYTAPRSEGHTSSDARLPGDGVAHYSIDQRLLTVTVGLLGRLPLHSELLAPYLALGYRGHFIASQVHGDVAGHAFGTNTERGYEHGFYAALGLDVFVGPGALLAELQFGYAASGASVLRDSNVGSLQLLVGYRLMFGSRAQSASSAGERSAAGAQAAASQPSAQATTAPAAETLDESAAAAAAALAADAPDSQPLVGQIRGNIRSFKGTPLRAAVVVSPGELHLSTTADGKFSLEVTAGHYSVHLSAPGYKPQTRDVVVDQDGITVLNVELGER